MTPNHNKKPLISVIMPVHNCGRYLRPAIESVLNQTFRDFEFFIITRIGVNREDLEIIKSFNDSRLKHIEYEAGPGIVPALNIGIKKANGKYVARMDGDDISAPERFQKQFNFLENHKEIGILGSQAIRINESGEKVGKLELPLEHEEISWIMAFKNPMAHPSIMARTEIFKRSGYTTEFLSEDYNLWSKLTFETKFANLSEPLLFYRFYPGSTTNRLAEEIRKSSFGIRGIYWNKFAPINERGFEIVNKMLSGNVSGWQFIKGFWMLRKFKNNFIKNLKPSRRAKQSVVEDYKLKLRNALYWKLKKLPFVGSLIKK